MSYEFNVFRPNMKCTQTPFQFVANGVENTLLYVHFCGCFKNLPPIIVLNQSLNEKNTILNFIIFLF
jgi:hypothetical protein